MASLKALKLEAIESCEFRGHKMGVWDDESNGNISECQCQDCYAWVLVEANPLCNGIDISGPAVAVFCHKRKNKLYKTFRDSLPGGNPLTLEAEVVGIYTDENGIAWTLYIPVSIEWQGMYHFMPVDGGEPWLPVCLDERRMIASIIQGENHLS